jgi:molybdenum cofactor guanylyltransferase
MEIPVIPPLVVVLAGGRGRRLGGAKPSAPLAGRPLIEYPLTAARDAGLEVVVVAKSSTTLPPLDIHLVLEPERPHHPLRGLVTALEDYTERRLLVLACDMPFVTARLLAALGQQPEAPVVCDVGGRLQPFPGLYTGAVLPELRDALAREAPIRSALALIQPRRLGAAWLAPFGDPARLCFSVNTPAQLQQAERWLAGSE